MVFHLCIPSKVGPLPCISNSYSYFTSVKTFQGYSFDLAHVNTTTHPASRQPTLCPRRTPFHWSLRGGSQVTTRVSDDVASTLMFRAAAAGASSSVVSLISMLGSPIPRLFSAMIWMLQTVAGCKWFMIPTTFLPSTDVSRLPSIQESPKNQCQLQ